MYVLAITFPPRVTWVWGGADSWEVVAIVRGDDLDSRRYEEARVMRAYEFED